MTIDFSAQRGGEGTLLEIGDAQLGGDREAGRNGQTQIGHLGEAGAFAPEDVAHGCRAIRVAIAEEVDVSFDRRHEGRVYYPLNGDRHHVIRSTRDGRTALL